MMHKMKKLIESFWKKHQEKFKNSSHTILIIFIFLITWRLLDFRPDFWQYLQKPPAGANLDQTIKYMDTKIKVAGSIITFILAITAMVLTLWRIRQTERRLTQNEEARLDTRFKDAVMLLGNEDPSVRIGGLYSLFEIAKSESKHMRENSNYHSSYPKIIVEIICGFIRNQSQKDYEKYLQKTQNNKQKPYKIKDDIQKALNILFLNHQNMNNYLIIKEGIKKQYNQKIITKKQYMQEILSYQQKFRNIIFHDAPNSSFDLSNAKLQYANLYNGYFYFANFFNIDLQGANLNDASLEFTNLDNANLQNATFYDANLQNTILKNANLQNSKLSDAYLENANFVNANLRNAELYNAQLQNASFTDANLQGANFTNACLQNTTFYDAQLQHTRFDNADLQYAWLNNANLQGASLYKANLKNTVLNNANFQKAILNEANLQDAILDNTSLQETKLYRTKFKSSSFYKTNLEKAQLDLTVIEKVNLGDIINLETAKIFNDTYSFKKFYHKYGKAYYADALDKKEKEEIRRRFNPPEFTDCYAYIGDKKETDIVKILNYLMKGF